MEQDIINVKYVSIWDGGTEIRTNAKYNRSTNLVYDIEQADAPDVDILENEFIELPSGERIERELYLVEE